MISSSSILRRYQTNSEFYRSKQSFRQTKLRYVALFLACMVMLGDAYCFDNPMALQSEIKSDFGISNIEFNLLYTVYSLPNIILPFFGGILIDKMGARTAIILFSTIILIGQLVCVVGAYYLTYWVMILGRVIFGMGSESLNASQNSIMAQWFRDKEMSLAIGLCISIPKVGSAANSFLSPFIIEEGGTVAMSMLLGIGFLVFSYVCAVILVYMDKESDRRETQSKRILENFLRENQDILGSKGSMMRKVEVQSFEKGKPPKHEPELDFVQTSHQPEVPELPEVPEDSSENQSPDIQVNQQPLLSSPNKREASTHHEAKEEINMRDIAKMSGTFWILIIICMLTEALFVPFLDNGNEFFQARFSFSAQEAGQYLMIPYLISAVATPIVGIIADKLGKRGWMIIITSFVFLGTHILLLLLSCTDVCLKSAFPLVFLGLCFAFYASCVIPSVPLVVKPQLIGTAFGLTGVFQNTALALFPLVTGIIFNQYSTNENGTLNESRGYMYQSYFFVGMSIFNAVIAVFLQIIDRSGARTLQGSNKTKKSIVSIDENPQPRSIDPRHFVHE